MNPSENSLVALPRGGFLIFTSNGPFQYGIPPETIKDTMKLDCGVPTTYIVPDKMFDFLKGISLADMEFPVYFNFFIKKGKTRILCSKEQQYKIKEILSEALFGPASLDIVGEHINGENTPGFPNLRAEMDNFKKMPQAASGFLSLSDLVEFYIFNEHKTLEIDDLSFQVDRHGNLVVREHGKQLAFIDHQTPIIPEDDRQPHRFSGFHPPVFGITTLGAGHGFDPNANTSGMIIWANRRGIIIDPPVNSITDLLRLGVSPKLIDDMILTHCHSDHDAGALQKILQEGKVNLYTTKTIFSSFMKKALALTGLSETQFKRMVNFLPVTIGKPVIISGAKFLFNYTLHSIPTISIQASLHDKSMIYSSDTMNDPEYIKKLYDEGILSKNRRDFLLNFPWDKTVIFHEAGIPPLHTPLSFLCKLPKEIRERTFLVHVNPDSISKDCGLRIAPTGLQATVELEVKELVHDSAIEILDIFTHIDIFYGLSIQKAREILLVSKVEHYAANEVIFRKDDPGTSFYVVLSGLVDIVLDGQVITAYDMGGYFGEKCIFIEEIRTASAIARTPLKLLSIDKDEMLSLIRGTRSESYLRDTATYQNVELRNILAHNIIIRHMSASQKTQLHGLIRPLEGLHQAGQTIIAPMVQPSSVYVIRNGIVDIFSKTELVASLGPGQMIGAKHFLRQNDTYDYTYVVRDPVSLYALDHQDFLQFLDNNPNVYMYLLNYAF